MGIWNIHKWNVLPEKMNEHEDVMKQMMQVWKRIMPTIQLHYFRQRFGPMNGRVLVLRSFMSLASWEEGFITKSFSDTEGRKLIAQLIACWDQSSHDEHFWDESWVAEDVTELMASD
jgi:hypothetical protein